MLSSRLRAKTRPPRDRSGVLISLKRRAAGVAAPGALVNRPKRIAPGPGQESVWDYPRPPRLEIVSKRIRVVLNDVVVADTRRAFRVLETSHPPSYYIPPVDIKMECMLSSSRGGSFCEWKGAAVYFTVRAGNRMEADAAWSYPRPSPDFAPIADHVAFYAGRMDACYVDDEKVAPQPGNFYGGWITSDLVGPFKGEPGSWGW
jgi:uncharacterized protein (DUF427 family)